jgi:hypothetical protein
MWIGRAHNEAIALKNGRNSYSRCPLLYLLWYASRVLVVEATVLLCVRQDIQCSAAKSTFRSLVAA